MASCRIGNQYPYWLRVSLTLWIVCSLTATVALAQNGYAVDTHADSNNNNHNNDDGGFGGYYYNNGGEGMYRNSGQYLRDWNPDWATMSGRVQQSKCVPIPSNLTLCSNIGYSTMVLPNLLEQDSLDEVTRQAVSWIPLVRIECHPDTHIFLCSLFSPVCLEKLIYPCRSLCEVVHNGCISRMKRYNFDWPEMLKCDQFPLDNDLCIKPRGTVQKDNNCSACRHPLNHESLIDHFCRSDIAVRVTVKSFKDDADGDRQLITRKKLRFYKNAEGLDDSAAARLVPVIPGGASCSCKTINATQQRYILMGKRQGDRLIVQFGMPWRKKDKEFKKGIRAIRKSTTCEGIFRELSATGVDKNGGGQVAAGRNETSVLGGGKPTPEGTGKTRKRKGTKKSRGGKKGKKRGSKKGKRDGKGKGKGKKDRKGRKGKGKGKGRKGGKKGRKDRKRKGNRRGGRKGKKSVGQRVPSAVPDQAMVSKWKAEDQALSNFMKLDN